MGEDRRMQRPLELDPGDPVLHPANPGRQGLQPRQRNPDQLAWKDPFRKFDPAPLGREVEDIHAIAMVAGAAEIHVGAKRDPLRAAV